jgi:hypothetical protein
MPKRLFRLVLLLLATLTVPVQGIAAVSSGICMALGHHSGGAPAHHHDDGKGTDKKDTHCPPCVSCCAAAAIASFHRTFSPERPGSWVAIALPAPFSGVPPDTLDRPPLAL